MLKLEYSDKYALWSDLIRSSTTRLFIETTETATIGSAIPLEVRSGSGHLPILLAAVVVGRRVRSPRFPAGFFIRISPEELEKCRRFLGLEPPEEAYKRARRTARAHCEVGVRFLTPGGDEHGTTRSLSSAGAFIATTLAMQPGQRLRLELQLPDGGLAVEADVQWTSANGPGAIGVRFVDVSANDTARLETFVSDALAHDADEEKRPSPVVVADDDPAIVDLLVTALSKHGFEVYEARTGRDALALIRQLRPRVVLLDILMPGLDGLDICKTMRADAELFETPVIFISALDEQSLAEVADEAGASDYMTKPLHLAELLNLVGEYLQGAG